MDGDNADKVGWAPIGGTFAATFDGNNNVISNLYVNRSSTSRVGLFGTLGTGGNVRNLGIEGGSLSGSARVGGLVGQNDGTISACYATGNVTGTGENVGGLVGFNNGTIRACYATGDASGTQSVGGLVGISESSGTIIACYATGAASGSVAVGGLSGKDFGTIRACYATGNATGTGNNVGGLSGQTHGPISACYATGDASGDQSVGGLVGLNVGSTISACYATGDASGSVVGGLLGRKAAGTVTNSYFDYEASNRPAADSYSKTTAQLQTPTAYAGIYSNWNIDVDGDSNNDDPWDFGTATQYPALKVDLNGDDLATAYEFGVQGRDAPPTVEGFTPASGAVSTSIKIWGTGFSSTATEDSISFGGSDYVVAANFIADTRAAREPYDRHTRGLSAFRCSHR